MEMIDLRSEGLQANTGARHPPTTSYTTPTPGESAVMFGVIIPVPLQKKIVAETYDYQQKISPQLSIKLFLDQFCMLYC